MNQLMIQLQFHHFFLCPELLSLRSSYYPRQGDAMQTVGTLNLIFNQVMEMLSVVQYYQTMNNKEKINQILADIQKIRLKVHIGSEKLQDFLYYQHLKVTGSNNSIFLCGLCGVSRKQVNQSFKRAFKTLSDLQKAQFYLLNIKNAQIILNAKNLKIQNEVLKLHEQPEKLKVILKAGQIVKKQSIVDVQLLKNEKIMRIVNKKVQIDLHNFLMRKSKGKDRNQIILQATHASPIGNTIRISNSGVQFEDILNIFAQVWKQAQFDNIYDIINKSKSQKTFQLKTLKTKLQIKDYSSNNGKNQGIPSNSEGSYQEKKLLYQQEDDGRESYMEVIQSFSSFHKFEQIRFGQSHEKKGLRVRKSILFSSPNWKCKPQQVYKLLTMKETLYKMKPFIKSLQVITKSNKQYEIKQVHEIEGKLFNFDYNRTFVTHHGTLYIIDKQQTIYRRKNTTKKLAPFVRHCIWRVRQIGNFVQLFVEAKVQYSTNLKNCETERGITSHFIGELSNISEIMNKKQQKQEESKKELQFEDEQQIFYTLPGSLIDDDKNSQQVQLPLQLQQFQQIQTNRNLNQNVQFDKKQAKNNFLIFKHIQKPYEKCEDKRIVSQKGHWLWQDEWVVKQNGDLVNINQEKINIQSSVLKLVIKNMSRNILSGKGILNTSLPIQIFGVDSNLQRLARGYIFGPIFLEKAAQIPDPVQRMKFIVCFALGFSLAYIKMEKPFNPILGETYQGLIDGCPVYGEQISHHPPISSLYMLGRGYKVYGSLQAKVEMGLNTAAGFNEGFNTIEFEKFKGKIRFTSPPGQLSGLIYGDRKITVTRKSYYFDQENRLYCEIQWGKKKSANDNLANSNDFFVGKIVKLKCQVSEKNYKNINKNDIIEEYGEMRGRLTKQVNFNNQKLFNVETLAPYQIVEYCPCLASDSRERKDIAYKKQNNLTLAQESKQQLQELQRRDKKLRHENKKKT